ncbi:MAG TPA: GAF domain-containing SpoIIE family protein phosphatase [Candidatus Baltobacteraceae bacterium]|jgi:serine phosphatase RsbU (regulator of sigma subunit)
MGQVERRAFAWRERDFYYFELLLRAGEILDRSLDYSETLQNVCAAAVETVANVCIIDLGPEDSPRLVAAAHRDPARSSELENAGRYLRHKEGKAPHPVREVIRSRNSMLVTRIDDEYLEKHSTSDDHRAFMQRLGYQSMMILPLVSQTSGVLGAMTLAKTSDEAPFDQIDLRFAADLARRCASAIAKAILHSKTVDIASRFQEAALPGKLPYVAGLVLDGFYEPSSEELLVGGDWYDAFEMPDGRIAITVGDVLGHGLEAAVWMGRLRNALRAAILSEPDPAGALIVADRLMRLDSEDAFSTALVAIVDPVHRTMSCASAGHPGPLMWMHDGTIADPISERSLPLGLHDLDSGRIRRSQTVLMKPGMFAVFFTDGLLEWNRDVPAAWDHLIEAMRRHDVRFARRPAAVIREIVIDGGSHPDDVAILTLRVDA